VTIAAERGYDVPIAAIRPVGERSGKQGLRGSPDIPWRKSSSTG
jgi:hypothetical protein